MRMNVGADGGHRQSKRRQNTQRTRSNTASANPPEQVIIPTEDMTGIDKQELSELIRSIMKEEVAVALTTLQPQLNSLKAQMEECGQKLDGVENGLNDMEERVAALEEDKKKHEMDLKQLHKENTELRDKLERLEAHSRKFNLRVFGLPIGVEKKNPTAYMNIVMKELFKGKIKTEPVVEIAHRVGPGNTTMMLRMQRYMAKEEILALSKKEGTLKHGEMELQFFPDLTSDMAKRRAKLKEIRGKLKTACVQHGIIHPATLIITHGNETRRFTDHKKAEAY